MLVGVTDYTFAAWMERALYHPDFGYYTSGQVAFGDEADFWTFPERLSPTFGRIVARHVVAMREALIASGRLALDETFVVVELGAGEGWLADDVLQALHDDFADVAELIAYRIGDRAPALRERQRQRLARWFEHGRVAHLEQGADELMPRIAPFVGVVLSNELFDVYPHELIRWDPNGLSRLVITDDGRPSAPRYEPYPTSGYLDALAPLVRRLGGASLLYTPGMDRFFDWVQAQVRAGFVMSIDYGGSAAHCLDPRPALPHLRVYPEPAAGPGIDWFADLGVAGTQDVTVDIDFSHLAFAGAERGFDVVHFGPQGDLAKLASIDPLAKDERARVVKRLKARGGIGELAAQQKAYETAKGFATGSAGFRVLVQATRGVAGYIVGIPSDPVLPDDLVVIDGDPTGHVPEPVAAALRRESDPYSDLDHAGFRAERHAHVAALLGAGVARRLPRV